MIKDSVKEKLLDYLTIEDLQGDTRMLGELTDLETVKKMISIFGGMSIHIQSLDILGKVWERYLIENIKDTSITKKNIIRIANMTNKTPRYIRNILTKINQSKREGTF